MHVIPVSNPHASVSSLFWKIFSNRRNYARINGYFDSIGSKYDIYALVFLENRWYDK